jgi:Holliday junction resolvase RusA-like endonuclease
MIAFLIPHKPKSANKKGKKGSMQKYQTKLKDYFMLKYPDIPQINEEKLYGIVYYFYRRDIGIDADNICKPIWDAFKTVLYNDDKIIKLVYSGTYDLNNDVNNLDMTKMPKNVFEDFIDFIDNTQNEDLLYIELGKLNDNLFIIGGETYETL